MVSWGMGIVSGRSGREAVKRIIKWTVVRESGSAMVPGCGDGMVWYGVGSYGPSEVLDI